MVEYLPPNLLNHNLLNGRVVVMDIGKGSTLTH